MQHLIYIRDGIIEGLKKFKDDHSKIVISSNLPNKKLGKSD